MKDKTAILDVKGADCAACAYAIEHLGRKVEGVTEVTVNTGNHEIEVLYGGNAGSLERIVAIVGRLGYKAQIRWDSIH